MKILVTGASGFLGYHLTRFLEHRYDVVACWNSTPVHFERAESLQFDFTDREQCSRILASAAPTHLIHAGAMTQTGECETDPDLARKVNVEGTANLLEGLCVQGRVAGRPPAIVFLSTDLVFDGRKPGGGYREEQTSGRDGPRPLMVYGRTKLKAERLVLDSLCRNQVSAAVVRSSLIYGPPTAPRQCFLDWMISGIRKSEGTLFRDEYRTPVYVSDLCKLIEAACVGSAKGVYHAGGPVRLSRYELGLLAAEIFGLPAENVREGFSAVAAGGTPRPADVSLDISRAARELGYSPRTPLEGFTEIREQGFYPSEQTA